MRTLDDAEGAFTKGWSDAGLQMLGSVRFPTTNPDFAPFVQRVKDASGFPQVHTYRNQDITLGGMKAHE